MMSVESRTEYVPGDPLLIRDIISQLKSQGVFDQFRKECISDVDTKPAYQNLCHRVDGQVSSYLSDIRWGPDLNKNQLRENIRKFVNECTFVEPGIARIVDQLVNPRINTVLVPKVEDIVYQYVGIPPIERHASTESSRDQKENHNFDNQDSSLEKSRSSNSLQKRNYENEPSWLRSPSRKFDEYINSRKESSGNQSSPFDAKTEPRDEVKEKNEDSRIDFFHSEGGEDDDSRAYSTIDSDEDNLNDDDEEPSPSFEVIGKPDTYNSASADSDYSADVASSKNNSQPDLEMDKKSVCSSVEHNDENTNPDSLDDRSSQADQKIFEELAPPQFDLPKTPTINYETSEDSDDNNCLKLQDTQQEVSIAQDHPSLVYDIPDFSSVDKIAQKIAEDNRELEKTVPALSADENVSPVNDDCEDQLKNIVESFPRTSEENADQHLKGSEKSSASKLTDSGSKDSKHRDRKHSEHRKEKHKSEKSDDRDRRHREKERSSHDSGKNKSSKSRTESRDKSRKSSDEKDPADDETSSSKSKSRDDHKTHKTHDDRKSRDKDDKKHRPNSSGERRLKDDKSKEKRSKSDDAKDERKRSRYDGDRSKEVKKSSQEEDKMKVKKGDDSENKKSSKSQCSSDEKKARTDRRSSDRDSNGPSSSSNHSHHRPSSKSDKEKQDKTKHTSSLSSSSHKSKKNSNTKCISSDRHSKDGCESSVSSKHKEHSHHEKKIDEKVSSSRTDSSDGCGTEQISKDSHRTDDADSKKKEEPKNSINISPCLTPRKRSIAEMNCEEPISASNAPKDGRSSPLKISENHQSVLNIKKPKIARNESEFGKVVKLRKEYKEKMRLLQQQGKENNNTESYQENGEKRIIEKLSPASTLTETRLVTNGNKNGVCKEIKLSITRIDACYKIINGSCFVNDGSSGCEFNNLPSDEEKSDILTDSDSKQSTFKIQPSSNEKQDKLFKIKICRSVSPTSGIERTKCVQSSAAEEGKDAETNSVSCPTGTENSVFYPPSENEEELEEGHLNDEELLRRMNIEEIIGCRTDCTRISYDSGLNGEKTASNIDDAAKERVVDKNVILFDENNKENVGAEAHCVNEASTNRSSRKSSPEVRYFEPSSPSNDFSKFITSMIQESQDASSLLDFSIELNYPKEYDTIFQGQLGATVTRTANVDQVSVDPTSIHDVVSDVAEEPQPHITSEETSQPGVELKDELKSKTDDISTLSSAIGSGSSKCESSHSDRVVVAEKKIRVANTTKRKTLGIKRKISCASVSSGTMNRAANSSQNLAHESQRAFDSRVCCPSSSVTKEQNLERKDTEVSPVLLPFEDSSYQNTFSLVHVKTPETFVDRLGSTPDEEKCIHLLPDSNVRESNSVPAKPTKKGRKNWPVKSNCELSLNELVPKRNPYKNKCYYDNSDLYKPRPSFLASSRRSRALNPDSK